MWGKEGDCGVCVGHRVAQSWGNGLETALHRTLLKSLTKNPQGQGGVEISLT